MAAYVYRGKGVDTLAKPKVSRKTGKAPRVIPPPGPVLDLPRIKGRKGPAKCGTRSGYIKHVREGTPKCTPCRIANAAYVAEYRERTGK